MRRFSLVLALFIVSDCLLASGPKVRIATQKQFDDAIARINEGEEMQIVLKKGTYVLNTSIKAHSPLSIEGNGATIIGTGKKYFPDMAVGSNGNHLIYKIDAPLSPFPICFDRKGQILSISESVLDDVRVNYLEGDIVAPQAYSAGTAIQLPIPSNLRHLKNKVFACSYGYLDSGWGVVNFQIKRSDERFFYCTCLSRCATNNYQYDRDVYKKDVRFVVYNAELKEDVIFFDSESLYIPNQLGVIYVVDSAKSSTITTYSDVALKGLSFMGIGGVTIHSKEKDRCVITDCRFSNCSGKAICIEKKNGDNASMAVVKDCSFMQCSLVSDNVVQLNSTISGRPCISMSRCVVSRYPDDNVGYKNPQGAIWANGDVCLTGNTVYNTCRTHLFMQWGSIVAQGNILYNTEGFSAKVDRNLSSDWGLVYCNHLFKETEKALANTAHHVLLENNLLFGAYAYGGDARGIFIDDGRGDILCRNNVILNSQLYSIDARKTNLTEASSVRNQYEGNIVTSQYRLAAGPAVKGNDIPVTKGNVLLNERENIVSNVLVIEEDSRYLCDSSSSFHNGKFLVGKDAYNHIKKSPVWKDLKKHIRKKGR